MNSSCFSYCRRCACSCSTLVMLALTWFMYSLPEVTSLFAVGRSKCGSSISPAGAVTSFCAVDVVGRHKCDEFPYLLYTAIPRVSGTDGSESLCSDGTKTRWRLQWMYYTMITRLGMGFTRFKALASRIQTLPTPKKTRLHCPKASPR